MEIFDSKDAWVYGNKKKETIQQLNAKFRTQLREMDTEDEKFFYGLRANIVFSTQESFNENTFFNLLKDTASRLFN